MTLPTIHDNGTRPERLAAAYEAAWDALDSALALFRACAPNGRDYYPQGPEAYENAADEHRARTAKVKAVMGELEELVGHCERGGR